MSSVPKCPRCGEQAVAVVDRVLVQSPIEVDEDDGTWGYADDRQEVLWDTQTLHIEENGKFNFVCENDHWWEAEKQ
jgi:hypothetical protein